MANVLIWRNTDNGSGCDIFRPTDYNTLYDRIQFDWQGVCQNWGNRLWFQGIYSAIDKSENNYSFLKEHIDIEEINSEFDFIILPMANFFAVEYRDGISQFAEIFGKIRIPVYVIAVGAQADSYDQLSDLISVIGEPSKKFIKAVYSSGGDFALRGDLTKEVVTKLGFDSAVVTGCPSLYQLGPGLNIPTTKVPLSLLSPVFNGRIHQFSSLMDEFPSSKFMDQDQLYRQLLAPVDQLDSLDFKSQANFANNYGFNTAKMISVSRCVMAADMNDWRNYLIENGFNYSYGTRIHGTIMALLSGIPATLSAHDSRTLEMAEFFDIPHVMFPGKISKRDVYRGYEEMDYCKFNKSIKQKYLVYRDFLINHGIVTSVNTNNRFFERKVPVVATGKPENIRYYAVYATHLRRNGVMIKSGNFLRNIIYRRGR